MDRKNVNIKDAVCVGCGRKSGEIEEYDNDNPVQDDGTYTYQDKKFVCTDCYCKLISDHLDIGTPERVQQNMIDYNKLKPENIDNLFKEGVLEI